MKLKLKMFIKILTTNKLAIAKKNDKTPGVAIKGFVGLKPKMYSFLVDNSEHKKAKSMNKNVLQQ